MSSISLIPAVQPSVSVRQAAPARFYELDLLRLVAALSVVLYHYAFRGSVGDAFIAMRVPSLSEVAKYGYLGVPLFLMISGFVILMSARSLSPKRFAISRLCRIYPALWACCTLTFVTSLLSDDDRFPVTWPQYLANMLLVAGYVGIEFIDGAYWSLFVEMQFYLMVFAISASGRLPRIDRWLAIWLVVAGFSAIRSLPSVIDRMLLLEFAGYFVAGATFYRVVESGWTNARVGLLAGSFVVSALVVARGAEKATIDYGVPVDISVALALLTAFFLVFLAIVGGWFARWGRPAWTRWGMLTYPLYLVHQNIGYMIINEVYPKLATMAILSAFTDLIGLGMLLALTAGMMGLAVVIHRCIELPIAVRLKSALDTRA